MTVTEAPPSVDPRLRARRIAVRREEGRRRLQRLGRLCALLVVAVTIVAATQTPVLDVDHIVVAGGSATTRDAVLSVLGIRRGDPMVDIDLGAARRRLEDLPAVDDASVTRRWPGTIRVRIDERKPVAAVPAATGGWAVVDAHGRVLSVSPEPPPGFIQLSEVDPAGEPGTTVSEATALALEVVVALPDEMSERVATVAHTADDGLHLALVDGGVVRWGSADDAAAKALAVATVLDEVEAHCVSVLDVRVPNAPALTPTPECVSVSTHTGG